MLLQRLKADTAERHHRLERDLDLMRPDLTRAAWARVVGRLYGFYQPWEEAVGRTVDGGDLGELVSGRRKAAWLASDLTELGIPASDHAMLPRCDRLPDLGSAARVLGGMYVLEGATLGGQFISRHVEATLGLADGCGYSFFRGYGAETGRMWPAFREAVSAYAPRVDADIIVASACETFDRLHNWLIDGAGETLTCR
jgi:heme oxygenase